MTDCNYCAGRKSDLGLRIDFDDGSETFAHVYLEASRLTLGVESEEWEVDKELMLNYCPMCGAKYEKKAAN